MFSPKTLYVPDLPEQIYMVSAKLLITLAGLSCADKLESIYTMLKVLQEAKTQDNA